MVEIPELTEAQAKPIVEQMKPIIDEKLLWFGFYKDEPVIFFLSLPEVNQIFKYLDGNLNWWGKIKFLWYKSRKVHRKAFGILFGIVPEHQEQRDWTARSFFISGNSCKTTIIGMMSMR